VRLLARIQRSSGLRPAFVLALALVGCAGASAVAAASSPAVSPSASVSQTQQRLSAGQQRVSHLAGAVTGAGRRVGNLGASIGGLQDHVSSLQHDLSGRRSQLLRLRDQLDAAQSKLGGLEAAKATAERVLAAELVGSYEGGRPDIIGVVLESNGFQDLLERLAFAQRISRQDARVVAHVRSARRAVATEARTLGRLTARAQRVADSVLSERNQVARYQLKLVAQQLAAARAKAASARQLGSAQVQVDQLTRQLGELRASQPASSASTGSAASGGTAPTASGATMFFPMPAGAAAPPTTWSLGDGVNIAAPAGTPELAVCTGTVVLHGIGGLGPSAPVLRCDQPLAGHTYVYYGFAGPKRLAAIGADVTRGQPLARVGAGIIGASTGPHLELGFADSSGAPLGPATARQLLALLRVAYAA
jgi:murein DD-endopeptidase MepM/ murein hydrolase activator NlpD